MCVCLSVPSVSLPFLLLLFLLRWLQEVSDKYVSPVTRTHKNNIERERGGGKADLLFLSYFFLSLPKLQDTFCTCSREAESVPSFLHSIPPNITTLYPNKGNQQQCGKYSGERCKRERRRRDSTSLFPLFSGYISKRRLLLLLTRSLSFSPLPATTSIFPSFIRKQGCQKKSLGTKMHRVYCPLSTPK